MCSTLKKSVNLNILFFIFNFYYKMKQRYLRFTKQSLRLYTLIEHQYLHVIQQLSVLVHFLSVENGGLNSSGLGLSSMARVLMGFLGGIISGNGGRKMYVSERLNSEMGGWRGFIMPSEVMTLLYFGTFCGAPLMKIPVRCWDLLLKTAVQLCHTEA